MKASPKLCGRCSEGEYAGIPAVVPPQLLLPWHGDHRVSISLGSSFHKIPGEKNVPGVEAISGKGCGDGSGGIPTFAPREEFVNKNPTSGDPSRKHPSVPK